MKIQHPEIKVTTTYEHVELTAEDLIDIEHCSLSDIFEFLKRKRRQKSMVLIMKNPNVRMSIMMTKDIWPAVVSTMECFDISYKQDKTLKDDKHVRINDISGSGADLMKLFTKLDQFCDDHDGNPRKIYILISAKRKGKKNVQESRKETGAGSDGGDSGEAEHSEPGHDPVDSGAGDWCVVPCADVVQRPEELESDSADDRGDQ